jgi:carboxypeptidase C (cathepsin A)
MLSLPYHPKMIAENIALSGKIDPMTQYNSTIPFAADAPGYGALVSSKTLDDIKKGWKDDCKPALKDCDNDGSDKTCSNALSTCVRVTIIVKKARGLTVFVYRIVRSSTHPWATWTLLI